MAERKLPAHLWGPGQSGNPNGRPKGTTFKKASPEAMNRIVHAYLYGEPNALEELFRSPDCTPNEKFIISVIQRAAHKGDAFALGLLLDRFIGKVTDKVEVKASKPDALDVTQLTDEELARRAELLDKANE